MSLLRLLAASCLFLSASAMADDVRDLREEVRDLRREVRELREEVRHLRRVAGGGSGAGYGNQAPRRDDGGDRTWGCYLQDIRAGAFYGTGRTEGEARGKTLEACSRKGGACFSNQVKCTRD